MDNNSHTGASVNMDDDIHCVTMLNCIKEELNKNIKYLTDVKFQVTNDQNLH